MPGHSFSSLGAPLTPQAYIEMEHQLQSEVSTLRDDYEAEIDAIRADAEAPLKQRNDLLTRDLKVSGRACVRWVPGPLILGTHANVQSPSASRLRRSGGPRLGPPRQSWSWRNNRSTSSSSLCSPKTRRVQW